MNFPEYVCETCGTRSVDWSGMCLPKGLGAGRGHDWVRLPDCLACGDSGYEDGSGGLYCTFCKQGCAVATRQMKAGIDPFTGRSTPHKSVENKETR